MPDRRRLITLSPGGRPILDIDLETTTTYFAIQDTFAYQPGAQNQQGSREPGRYGGSAVVGESNDNGTVSWQALVRGSTPDQVAGNIEALLQAVNRSGRDRLLEWRPDGATYSSYFRIAGPAGFKPTYSWKQWQGAQSMLVDVMVPVRPLPLWDRMTISDPFDVDSLTDYTFDASTSADVTIPIPGSGITPVVGAALTTERGARHTCRGYKHTEGQATARGLVITTITNYKLGVRLRASASTYIHAYIDDNGTNSRLRIDLVVAGVPTNKTSTNLGSRLATGNAVTVRGRVVGLDIVAEYWLNTLPTPLGAPTLTNTVTMTAPENASLPGGHPGWSWIPVNAGARVTSFAFQPYARRDLALPQVVTFADQIPGTAPALADVEITPSGGTDPPAWAMIGWSRTSNPLSTVGAVSIQEAETATLSGGWAVSAQAGARGGNDVRVTTSVAGSFTAILALQDVDLNEPDDFSDGQVDIEVWALVIVSSGNVNPRIRTSSAAFTGGGTRYAQVDTIEYGAAGKALVKPTSGTVRRYVRLGTVPFDCDGTASPALIINGTVDTGSTGVFGIDYIGTVPARRRAAAMTGVPSAAVAPFAPSTSQWTATVRSDLSGALGDPTSGTAYRVPGLGGALIQPSPGWNQWLFKLSTLTPDDPTVSTLSEQLAHQAAVAVNVTPRSYMLRGA